MLDVRPFDPEDVRALRPQAAQPELVSIGDWQVMIQAAATTGPAWTARHGGRVIGCAGISLRWRGRAHLWCVLADGIPRPAWIGLHRAVRTRLADAMTHLALRRLDAEVRYGFLPGARWLRMLGFEHEGLMRCWGPDGADFSLWALVR